MLEYKRVVGDTLSLFAVQLTRNGMPVDVTGLTPKFTMVDAAGNVIVDPTTSHVTVSNPTQGDVEYDFQAADVANPGTFYAFFEVVNGSGEVDTYPEEVYTDTDGVQRSGIKVTLFTRTANREPADPSIDIVGLASAPVRTRTVEGTVEERTVNELVKADQYVASKAASADVPWGIRIARTRPGGMVT